MADGEIRVKLDADTERRLRDAADAAGRSVDEQVRVLIAEGLAAEDWAEDLQTFEEYDRTGLSHSVQEGFAAFDAAVKRRLAK